MAEELDGTPVARDGRRARATLVAAAVAIAVVIGGLGVANAQTSTTTRPGDGGEKGGRVSAEKGDRDGLHGERVVPAPGGGYQTVGRQGGTATKVSATSITVKSDDDFTRTYAIGEDTVVVAGNNGIADVKEGDRVVVVGIIKGDKAAAVHIHDRTQLDRIEAKAGAGPARGERRGDDDFGPGGPGGPGDRRRP